MNINNQWPGQGKTIVLPLWMETLDLSVDELFPSLIARIEINFSKVKAENLNSN